MLGDGAAEQKSERRGEPAAGIRQAAILRLKNFDDDRHDEPRYQRTLRSLSIRHTSAIASEAIVPPSNFD
jgi:hypothetical protein